MDDDGNIPPPSSAPQLLLMRSCYEVLRDRDTGRVFVRTTDYHAGELTIDKEFIDCVLPMVGDAPNRQNGGQTENRRPVASSLSKALLWVLLAVALLLVIRRA